MQIKENLSSELRSPTDKIDSIRMDQAIEKIINKEERKEKK